jgi:hypothetical protein
VISLDAGIRRHDDLPPEGGGFTDPLFETLKSATTSCPDEAQGKFGAFPFFPNQIPWTSTRPMPDVPSMQNNPLCTEDCCSGSFFRVLPWIPWLLEKF